MTGTQLARVVLEMRTAQKEYFRTRSNSTLDTAKRLEAKVDRCVSHVLDGQRRLFGEEH